MSPEQPGIAITPSIANFLESGLSLLVGTRSRELVPEALRAVAARVLPDRRHVALFVPLATAARTIENLRDNGRVAVTFSNPLDHTTFQAKGHMTQMARAADSELPWLEAYFREFAAKLDLVGLPPKVTYRMARWPAWNVEFRVEEMFAQTPGPLAGSAIVGDGP